MTTKPGDEQMPWIVRAVGVIVGYIVVGLGTAVIGAVWGALILFAAPLIGWIAGSTCALILKGWREGWAQWQ
jgi:hypothetical protein